MTEQEKQDLQIADWIISYMLGFTELGRVLGNARQWHNEEWRAMLKGLGAAARGVAR